jgi:hypothetical protein
MDTVLFVLLCIAIAAFGAWDSTRCRHHRRDKLPEDIQ